MDIMQIFIFLLQAVFVELLIYTDKLKTRRKLFLKYKEDKS